MLGRPCLKPAFSPLELIPTNQKSHGDSEGQKDPWN